MKLPTESEKARQPDCSPARFLSQVIEFSDFGAEYNIRVLGHLGGPNQVR